MKKVLVLVTELNNNKSTFVKLLKNHVGNELEVDCELFENLIFEISENGAEVFTENQNILEYDLVIFRGVQERVIWIAGCVAMILKKYNKKYFDTVYENPGLPRYKLSQEIEISLNGILVPNTIFFSDQNLEAKFEYLAKKLGLPFVAKNIYLERGRGVSLVKNVEDLKSLPTRNGYNPYLFQKFIEKDQEFRMLILGTRVGVWYEKLPKEGEFRGNTALGAQEKYLDKTKTPKSMAKVGIQAAKILGLQLAGVDVMTEKGSKRVYFIEANRGPGLTYDESLSPEVKNVSEFILREAKKKRWPKLL